MYLRGDPIMKKFSDFNNHFRVVVYLPKDNKNVNFNDLPLKPRPRRVPEDFT